MDVIVICGATGIGKSTLAWEVGRQLEVAGISHAIVDTDELDRVYPQPKTLSELVELTSRNLKSVLESFSALGHTRIILSGVMLDFESDLEWMAIPVNWNTHSGVLVHP